MQQYYVIRKFYAPSDAATEPWKLPVGWEPFAMENGDVWARTLVRDDQEET